MNQALIVIVGMLAAGVAIFFVIRWKKNNKASLAWRNGTDSRVTVLLSRAADVSSQGVPFYFEPGHIIEDFPLEAVAGIDDCLARAACEYQFERSRFRPVICVLAGEQMDSRGDPCFKVYINMHNYYYNGEWDQMAGKGNDVDHYVLVAGQITRMGEPDGEVIAIPFHNRSQVAHARTIIDYEFEHGVLSHCDVLKYEATKVHGGGQGHPLISGDCVPQKASLIGPRKMMCAGQMILTK